MLALKEQQVLSNLKLDAIKDELQALNEKAASRISRDPAKSRLPIKRYRGVNVQRDIIPRERVWHTSPLKFMQKYSKHLLALWVVGGCYLEEICMSSYV